ncbi:hypothetical protein [Mycolicibacterium arenosum]|uniref:Methyl-accepting chemotaxis protein n=1 Tax=Mycolicibacterium arenosum TaxID=2952157 RepID=A0ABT1MDK5_9MYCO|nr:hypothetical protein [Mycolicibacterium sp. CAU 1645]MCP9276482.1 hypothetical protein [Mycolicibacterium sp. CAU 1645]
MASSTNTASTTAVASTAGGAAKTASDIASAVEGVGQRLYADAVRVAKSAGSGTARTAASEAGDGPFARAIKAGRRYSDGLYQHLRDWQDFHDGVHRELGTALDRSSGYENQFNDTLTGEAGDAVQSDLRANSRLWGAHQDKHESASQAAHTAAWKVSNAQGEIDDLAEAGEREFNDAVCRKDPVAALDVYTRYSTEADNVVAKYHPEVVGLVQNAGFDIPLSPALGEPGGTGEGENGQTRNSQRNPKGPATEGDATNAGADRNTRPSGTPDGTAPGANPGAGTPLGQDSTRNPWSENNLPPTAAAATATADAARNPAPSALPSRIPQMPSGGSGGSGSSGGGSGMGSSMSSGLGSATKPPSSLGSLSGANAGTSPASALSSGSPAQAAPSPMANAGSNFQSGLASGMGASGGMSPVTPQHVEPLQPMATQQPMVTSSAPVSPAGIAPSGWTPTPDAAAAGHGGGSASAGATGGTMMPPTAMGAAQPLAPYTPAGSGAGGAGGGASTSAAAGGSSGAQPGAPAQSAASAGAAPPMLAGNPGSSAAMSALAGTSRDVNPDVVLAQRVLAELVAGSDASTTLATWAVSVLRSSFGPQIFVAGNMGGGWYLPESVYLPAAAKLAVCDPALPVGWAATWMGSQKPSRILIDHFDRLRESVNGVSGPVFSALVTTDRAGTPSDFSGDYVAMEHVEARALCPEPPALDAAHQHRLTTIHQALAERVDGLAGHANAALTAATILTNVVYTGMKAHSGDLGFGQPLVAEEDERILGLQNRGLATDEAWAEYDAAVQIRGGGAALWPEQFQGVQDNDDSETAKHAMRLYEHYYRTSRFIELVNCWRRRPPPLAEIAYCAITAGFGAAVVQTLNDIEVRAGGPRA